MSNLPEKLSDFADEQIKTFADLTQGKVSTESLTVLLDGLDKVIPDGNVVDDFIKSLSGGLATVEQLKGFAQLLPGKLQADAVGQVSSFLNGIGGKTAAGKIKELAARVGKALPTGSILKELTDVLGGAGTGKITDKIAGLLKKLPNQLESVGMAKIASFVKSLKDKLPTATLLGSLAKGIGKVPDTAKITAFLGGLGGKVPGADKLSAFLEQFEDAKAAKNKLDGFVNGLGESASAQNDWWRTLTSATGLKTEQTLQDRFTKATCNTIGGILGKAAGCDEAGKDGDGGRRDRRAEATGGAAATAAPVDLGIEVKGSQSMCHTSAAVSVKRLFDAKRRFNLERMRNLRHRLLELFHKQRRQLEYKWLEDLDDKFKLPDLSVASFRSLQADLSNYNIRKDEASSDNTANERVVSYTVSREQYPEEFSKLGAAETVKITDSSGKQQEIVVQDELVFTVNAPPLSRWYASYVTKVEAYLVPFSSGTDQRVTIKMVKDTSSLFLKDDGKKANAVTFQHATNTRYFDYALSNCKPASKQVLDSSLIRYSPYGKWRLQVQTQDLKDRSSLLDVTQIQLRFTLQQKTVETKVSKLPMFADDMMSPEGISVVVNSDTCPVEGVAGVKSEAGAGSSDDESDSSGAGMLAGIVAAVVILLCVVVVVVVVKTRPEYSERYASYASSSQHV